MISTRRWGYRMIGATADERATFLRARYCPSGMLTMGQPPPTCPPGYHWEAPSGAIQGIGACVKDAPVTLTAGQRAIIAAGLAKMQAANLTDAQRAAIAAGLAKMQAPAMSSGAKVAAVGAAGAGAALLWWFASHGWRWVTPRFLKR